MGFLRSWARLVRARDWTAWVLTYSVGALSVGASHLENFLLGLLVCGPFLGGGAFAINQYFDVVTDSFNENKKKLALVNGDGTKKTVLALSFFSFAAALLVAFFVGRGFFETVFFCAFLCVAYSVPPIRLKKRPFFDVLTNGLGGYLFFAAGAALATEPWETIYPLGFLFALAWSSSHLIQALGDYSADEKAGIKTSVVALGKKNAKTLLVLLVLAEFFYLNYLVFAFLGPWFFLVSLVGVYWIYLCRGIVFGETRKAVRFFDETKIPIMIVLLTLFVLTYMLKSI